jgi:general secretion pathway protein J
MKLRSPVRSGEAGFTLIEMLIATALMVTILVALGTITAQWLPNWNRGFERLQRTELAAIGLERIVADLSAAEFIPPYSDAKGPMFEGDELSVTFVRSALGPNTRPGLEVVQIASTADERGLAMVRVRAPFVPLAPDGSVGMPTLGDPVVLVRAPYRISFSYAGPDRVWRDTWRDAEALPGAVRVTLRDAATAQTLAISTVAMIHINASAECVLVKNPRNCGMPNADQPNGRGPDAEKQL